MDRVLMDSAFARIVDRLERAGIARTDLVGCTESEIQELERRCGLRLPLDYRRYLALMGHCAGRLFSCDHIEAEYRAVCTMRDEAREYAEDSERPHGWEQVSLLETLGSDGLLIAHRMFEQFMFIRCSNEETSPVWWFSAEFEVSLERVADDIVDWLNQAIDYLPSS